jgi:hypothetical protein
MHSIFNRATQWRPTAAVALVVGVGTLLLAPLNLPVFAQSVPVLDQTTGHYYEVVSVPEGVTWLQARNAAQGMTYEGKKGHLVTINSAAENLFMSQNFLTAPQLEYWIGGYQDTTASDFKEPGGGWRWVTGELFGYANWRAEEPNNGGNVPPAENYLHIKEDGKWNDLSGNAIQQGYIVEYESNLPPIAQGETYYLYTANTKSLVVAFPGVLANDSDAEGNAVTAVLDSSPSSGTLVFNSDGSFSYRAKNKKVKFVSFTYQVSDGALLSAPATVNIYIAKKPPK